jgi:hypothetical protein
LALILFLHAHVPGWRKCPLHAGVFEAGCFPGSFYHLSLFFTSLEVGFAYATVASSTALSNVIGAPLAAGILYMDGLGGLR